MPNESHPASGSFRAARPTVLIVASALFMEQLDGTVLATALPAMARDFGTPPLYMNVALTSYLLTLAMFIPASGRMADRFGSRTVFCAAIGVFTLGSVLCGISNGLGFLVAARMLQGAGGALMSPVGRLVMLRAVTKADLVRAMAWLMIPATIGPILGPPVGGLIVTYLSWRWIFFINLPIGIGGIILAGRFVADYREPTRDGFDLAGLALSGTALACLLFGIEMASRGVGGSTIVPLLAVVGLGAALLYARRARSHPRPILDFSLMRIPTFRLSVLAGSCSRIAAGAQPFILPMMLQVGFGYSAARSGAITFASSAGALLMRTIAPGLLRRIGFRPVMVWIGGGSALLIAACGLIRPQWPLVAIYGLLAFGGFVQSLMFMAYNTIAYADVAPPRMSTATSFYTTFQQVALSTGIAVSAAALSLSVALMHHAGPLPGDFTVAFAIVGGVAMLAPLSSMRVERGAGAELTGERQPAPALVVSSGVRPQGAREARLPPLRRLPDQRLPFVE